jgi:hypothetical protein
MSDAHEDHLIAVLGGRKTRGSGSTFRDQGDGKQAYASEEFIFCWDGKSTLGKSLSISKEMWQKIREQSHWARPAIPIRFYGNTRLTEHVDLIACDLQDFADMQACANETIRLRDEVEHLKQELRKK